MSSNHRHAPLRRLSPREAERLLHDIAHDLHIEPDTISKLFTIVLRRFERDSSVGDYLSIFVRRRVKHLYEKLRIS